MTSRSRPILQVYPLTSDRGLLLGRFGIGAQLGIGERGIYYYTVVHTSTHAQVRVIATDVLKRAGDDEPLGKKWTTHFLNCHPELKMNLGRRTN